MPRADFAQAFDELRFCDSFGSWNSAFFLRQSSLGKSAARSLVIAPVSRPEAIGE